MTSDVLSLRQCLADARRHHVAFEESNSYNSTVSQSNLEQAITGYEGCLKLISDVSLFSPNEELEDVSSRDLQYLLLHFRVAELKLRLNSDDCKACLESAATSFDSFLHILDTYRALSTEDLKLYEQYQENPQAFSVASTTDAAARRQTKIAKFKEEKVLKDKIRYLQNTTTSSDDNDSVLRELHLSEIRLRVKQTFQHLESIGQELHVLSLALPSPPSYAAQRHEDERIRSRNKNGQYSDRLDAPLSQLLANGNAGPILGQDGRPLRPFTLLDTRQRVQNGVFGPDHSLPTMTIDEYLEEEKRRGGMIDGGGPQSQFQDQVDEDDYDKLDEATMKARQWDEYVEENPKGAGNTMNMG